MPAIGCFLLSCQSPPSSGTRSGDDTENGDDPVAPDAEMKLDVYRYPEGTFEPERTEMDRDLAQKIRDLYRQTQMNGGGGTSDEIHFEKYRLRHEAREVITQYTENETSRKVTDYADALRDDVTAENVPSPDLLGHWYRIIGRPVSGPEPVSLPDNFPYDHQLYRILVMNPAGISNPRAGIFSTVYLTEPIPDHLIEHSVLRIDGLLWNIWLPASDPHRQLAGDTPQRYIPVYLATGYTVIQEDE